MSFEYVARRAEQAFIFGLAVVVAITAARVVVQGGSPVEGGLRVLYESAESSAWIGTTAAFLRQLGLGSKARSAA